MKRIQSSSRLIIILLLLTGLLLLIISQNYGTGCWGNILSAIGQTLIGSSVVSFFLTIEDVQTLFLGIIKDILVDYQITHIFNTHYLEKMHSVCHRILYFHNMNINENDWKYLSDKCLETFTSPYYNNWRENIECRLTNNKIEKNFFLDYELINPMVDGKITANISRNYILDIPISENKNDYIQITSLVIELDGQQITCHPFVEFSQNDNKVYNTKACVKCNEYDLEKISFNNKLKVKMKLTTKVSIEDKSYTHRLRYAARHYLLDFTCADSRVSIYPNFYGGFIELDDYDRHNVDSHVLVECKDQLILPGSGASIVLNFNEKNKTNKTRKRGLKSK